MKATTTIPIVVTSGVDPVSAGLMARVWRAPAGTLPGSPRMRAAGSNGKRFELLKETLQNLSRLGILFNPDNALRTRQTSMGESARALGLTLVPVEARGLDALEQAFAMMVRERAQAFFVQGDGDCSTISGQIATMALRNRLPAASYQKEYCGCGLPSDLRG